MKYHLFKLSYALRVCVCVCGGGGGGEGGGLCTCTSFFLYFLLRFDSLLCNGLFAIWRNST